MKKLFYLANETMTFITQFTMYENQREQDDVLRDKFSQV